MVKRSMLKNGFISANQVLVYIFSDTTEKAPTSNRNLWISGLSNSTKATDLKNLFTKYGKVNSTLFCVFIESA